MINKQPDAEFTQAYWDYLKQFEYRLTVKLGPSHTDKFKEFTQWCQSHLGIKYRDWFMTSNGKGTYTLHVQSSKWATFLALAWFDVIS
jgi:hypothetical protein